MAENQIKSEELIQPDVFKDLRDSAAASLPVMKEMSAVLQSFLLLTKDIRDIIPKGIVIDDHEVLAKETELVRLKEILEINFKLPGLKVQSESGRSYGKVADFAFETSSFFIKKIYANQSLVKNFSGGSISIDRTQVLEITDRRIIISDPTEKARLAKTATEPA